MVPEWCSQDYLGRYVGGQVSITNRYIDTSFHGEIGAISLDETAGRLTIGYTWFAVGVDSNNRCSLVRRSGWVESSDAIKALDLWVDMNGQRMMLYTGKPTPDGRLALDGGELMEAIFTFLPADCAVLQRSEVRPADPNNPVDRTIRYIGGRMPGGTAIPGGGSYAMYEAGTHSPKRVSPDDGK